MNASYSLDGAANLTDNETGSDANRTGEEWPLLASAVNSLTQYYMPALITCGLIGNTFSVVIFLSTFLNRLSLSVYLAALAVSDSGFLLSLLFGWMKKGKQSLFHSGGWCQIVVFLSYTCSFLSVWFVVAFTVERYIAICHPLSRPTMCTTGRAKKVVGALSLGTVLIYLCNFWTTGIIQQPATNLSTCTPLREYYAVHVFLTYVDAVATLFLPFLIIVVFNITITHRIAYFYHKRQRLMSATHYGEQNARQCRAQIKVTKMLMVVSSVFIVTNLPSYVVRCRVFLIEYIEGEPRSTRLDLYVQKLVQFLYYTNFAVNFLLYSAASRKFRVAFVRLFIQWRLRMFNATSATMTSIRHQASTTHKAVVELQAMDGERQLQHHAVANASV